jgi:hypothetical protein
MIDKIIYVSFINYVYFFNKYDIIFNKYIYLSLCQIFKFYNQIDALR